MIRDEKSTFSVRKASDYQKFIANQKSANNFKNSISNTATDYPLHSYPIFDEEIECAFSLRARMTK